jgi:hypothetical protein
MNVAWFAWQITRVICVFIDFAQEDCKYLHLAPLLLFLFLTSSSSSHMSGIIICMWFVTDKKRREEWLKVRICLHATLSF